MNPAENLLETHPWLAPEQMALAQQVVENERLRRLAIWHTKSRKKPPLRTHCCRGHELKGDNLRVYSYGRQCLLCIELRNNLRKIEERRKQREAVKLLQRYNIRDRALVASARNPKSKSAAA